jgi:hypothetical protein
VLLGLKPGHAGDPIPCISGCLQLIVVIMNTVSIGRLKEGVEETFAHSRDYRAYQQRKYLGAFTWTQAADQHWWQGRLCCRVASRGRPHVSECPASNSSLHSSTQLYTHCLQHYSSLYQLRTKQYREESAPPHQRPLLLDQWSKSRSPLSWRPLSRMLRSCEYHPPECRFLECLLNAAFLNVS